jgi:hypothetical protein
MQAVREMLSRRTLPLTMCTCFTASSRPPADCRATQRTATLCGSISSGHLWERDETCSISTEGWTRRVHFVREGGGGERPPARAERSKERALRARLQPREPVLAPLRKLRAALGKKLLDVDWRLQEEESV